MPDLNKAYSWAINTCNAPNIGYSQSYRNQRTVNGITYYDCSSFIWYALIAGGWDMVALNNGETWPFTTATMINILLKPDCGFIEVSIDGEWKPGDICWRSGHTEMVYSGGNGDGITMGAHSSRYALASQVSINTNTNHASSSAYWFTRIFRYGDAGASDTDYSIYVIAALCGNAWRESNINPSLHQRGGTAFGIFQWDGGRLDAMLSWLAENGYEENSANGQLSYFLIEPPEQTPWIQKYGEYKTLQEFLESKSTDVEYLTECFCKNWERAGTEAMDERIANANKCLDYIRAHANDETITTWIQPDKYLTESQILNNAVMLYRFFSSGGGGGNPFISIFNRMALPLWLKRKF